MATLGELIVKIAGDTGDLEKSIDSADKKLSAFATGAIDTGKKLSTFVTLPLLAMGTAFVALADKQQRAEAALTNAIRATGRQATISVKNLSEYASGLQAVTTFGDEAQLSALALVQQLADLDEQGLKAVLPGLLDFSEAMGVDLQTAAALVGKTLGSSTNALARYGIEIDTSLGPTERLAQLTGQLETRFGGAAEAAAQAGLGPLRQLKNSLGDLGEQFGNIIIPVITDFVEKIQGLVTWLADLDEGQKRLILTVAGVAAAIGPLLFGLGSVTRLVTTLTPLVLKLNLAFLANPIVLAAAAVVGLTTALVVVISRLNDATREQRAYREELEKTTTATLELGDAEIEQARADLIRQQAEATRAATQASRRLAQVESELSEIAIRRGENTWVARQATVANGLAVDQLRNSLNEARRSYETAADKAAALGEALKAIDDEIEQRTLPLRQQQAAIEAQAAAERLAALEEEARLLKEQADEAERLLAERRDMEEDQLETKAFLRARDLKEAAEAARQEVIIAEESAKAKLKAALLAMDEEVIATEVHYDTLADLRDDDYADYLALLAARKDAADRAQAEELERQRTLRAAYFALVSDLSDLSSALADRQIADIEATVENEEDRDEQIRAIRRREAARQKALGLFNVAIDTAQAIIRFLANPGGFVGVGLSIAAGISGALQAAAIAARPLPALAQGGIVPARPGGTTALIGEGGQPEVVFPLDRLQSFLAQRPDLGGMNTTPIQLTVEMDSAPIFSKVFDATRDRRILIDARAVV